MLLLVAYKIYKDLLFYLNENWYKNKCNGSELAKRFTVWLAKWSKAEQTAYPMWQFGGETNYIRSNKVAGVVCDQDYCFEDFPTIIKNAGLNGYAKGTIDNGTQTINNNVPVSQPTTTTETTYVVKKGDTLSGIASKFGTTYQKLAEINGISNYTGSYNDNTKLILLAKQGKLKRG